MTTKAHRRARAGTSAHPSLPPSRAPRSFCRQFGLSAKSPAKPPEDKVNIGHLLIMVLTGLILGIGQWGVTAVSPRR
jgi:hypothetical protein